MHFGYVAFPKKAMLAMSGDLQERVSKDPFDRNRLEGFVPDLQLARHFEQLSAENRRKRSTNPDAGKHNLVHFLVMRDIILDARCRVRSALSGDYVTVVLGAKECNDVPLQVLAREGDVYLVDVDRESLSVARGNLEPPSLREQIRMVWMDASLFVTGMLAQARSLLQRHHADIDRGFRAVDAMHVAGNQGFFRGKSLPLKQRSVDLAICSMTLCQFMVGYMQVLLQLFLDVYGRAETRRYLFSDSSLTEEDTGTQSGVDRLQRSTSRLVRKAVRAHLRELCRITKKGGVIILSDHALQGRCVLRSHRQVVVDVGSLVPYSKSPWEERHLRYRRDQKGRLPPTLNVELTKPDQTLVVEGRDALRTAVKQEAGMEILDGQGWWWVTEKAEDSVEDFSLWHVSYVEALTLTPVA
jgi:hypothetical protein